MTTSGYGSDHHMHFSQSNLIDNCYTENSGFYAFYRPYGGTPMHNITSTHSAFWNLSSGGTKAYCIWTQQSRYGYAIGTSGTESAVYTKENATGTAAITDPVDIVEGIGKGATLDPQSLYIDQLSNRTAKLIMNVSSPINTENTFNIYPNPAETKITVEYARAGGIDRNIQIFNASGQEVFRKNMGDDLKLEINVVEFPRGIYLVKSMGNIKKLILSK